MSHYYKPLPINDREPYAEPQKRTKTKRFLFRLLVGIAIMTAISYGIRYISRNSKFGMRRCQWTDNRTLMTLPSHYSLPSGDKIPSVALGTVITSPVNVTYLDRARSRVLEGR